MKVSELSRRTGVSTHRLRRYEAEGLLRAVRRASGYREFDERSVREVVFIAMGRDLGFSLPQIAEALPRYRAGTLGLDEMVRHMRDRIAEVDALIEAQRALRRKLVSHIGWLERRQARPTQAPTAWPATKRRTRK
jgi:DNA-binding transcriptional MerR regulator